MPKAFDFYGMQAMPWDSLSASCLQLACRQVNSGDEGIGVYSTGTTLLN